MNNAMSTNVKAAGNAAWCTVIIGAAWMSVAWLVFLVLTSLRPGWIITLWGGELTWPQVNMVMVYFFGAAKLLLFIAVLLAIWLTIWAKMLRQAQ